MSEDRQTRTRRSMVQGAPRLSATPEPGGAAEPGPTAALPPPDPVAALPAPLPEEPRAGADHALEACHAALASFGATQAAIAGDLTAVAQELGGLARANLTAAGDSLTALCGARTMADAVEIQLGFARRVLGLMAGGSARLNDLGLRVANDAARPMLNALAAG